MKTTDTTYKMLIVEDDADVGMGLQDFFELKGYDVALAIDGEKALDMMQRTDFDIVLLDVMMPKKNGFEVLRESQDLGVATPVLMLTAKGDQEDILRGFGLGVDDYVTKPFNAEELAARVKAILNRTLPPDKAPMSIYRIGDVEVAFEPLGGTFPATGGRFNLFSPTDEPRVADGVMRTAKWSAGYQSGIVSAGFARHTMDLCGLKRLFHCKRWQNARQTFAQHGLSRTRRTNQYHVMPSRSGHLKRPFNVLLSLYVRKIRL